MLTGSNEKFWEAVDTLVHESRVLIDRPKGTHHPRFPNMVYPVDYGYLENTTSPDGNGIDVYRGTASFEKVDAIICTIDLMKRDSEIKLLIGCNPEEKNQILAFHNESEYMKGLLVERE
ncbi:MAG TPA: inorganic pyrophosphatase [Dehalococcoidia bacterium]|nr:inorganic pyrophosphatase [Dehalococcoidia bacterium]